ncbi:hypothetical protein Aduo_007584 [Ancylostoma duodenale]
METEENTTNETNISAVEIPAPPVKKRGRPPKHKTDKTEPVTQSEEASPNEENIPDGAAAPPPKKRGRKSKAELAALAANRGAQGDAEVGTPPLSPSSEKRTRAPAYSYAEYSDASEGSEDDEAPVAKSPKASPKRPATTAPSGKRKRGRPPKAHKSEASTPAPKPYTPGKRGRPPKNRVIVPAETDEKEKKLDNGHEKRSTSPSEISHRNESSIVITEKRRRGRPKKSEKTDEGGKWSDVSAKNTGKFDLPLPVPESWPLVNNMEEIMTELAEMYSNVKVEKRGEFHNQIKAFVFALHWV